MESNLHPKGILAVKETIISKRSALRLTGKLSCMLMFMALCVAPAYGQKKQTAAKANAAPVVSAEKAEATRERGREQQKGEVNMMKVAVYQQMYPPMEKQHYPANELHYTSKSGMPKFGVNPNPSLVRTRGAYSAFGPAITGGTPPPSAELPTSSSPADTFQAREDNSTYIPPDTHGAVDSNYCMTTVNGSVRIQTRTGTTVSNVTLDAFFSSVLSGGGTFDPRIHYDILTKRWIIVAVAGSHLSSSCILIGVSKTSNPTGAWWLYKVTAYPAGDYWLDFPNVGFNSKWVTITGNLFHNTAGTFGGCKIFAFNKANLLNGTGASFTAFTESSSGTLCPAIAYDAGVNSQFLVERWNHTSGYCRLTKITGAVGSESFSTVGYPSAGRSWHYAPYTVSGTAFSDFAPQLGSANKLQNGDDRITQMVMVNGKLWWSHTVFLPYNASANATRSSIQWWQADTTATPIQVGVIDDATGANFYAYPTIAVNSNNDALVGFSTFSSTTYASAAYAMRMSSDPTDSIRPVRKYRNGRNTYYKTYGGSKNRWGDYSATMVDPASPNDFWTIQEAAQATANQWDTWWAHITTSECSLPGITGTTTVCTSATTTLSNATSGGAWSSSNTSVATINASTGVVTGVATGTATISYVVSTCTVTTTVTVNAAPATISGSSSACVGSTITLTNSVSGGTWSSSATAVATVGLTSGIVTGVAGGVVTISYNTSCGSAVKTITVNALPAAITGTASVCVGSSTTLSSITTGGAWSSSMPSVASVGSGSGIVTGGIAGTATVTYTVATGCYVTKVVTVNAVPAAIGGTASACSGGTTTLTNATTGGTWSSGTTSVATIGTSGIVTGVASGTSIISYTLSTGCRATIVVTIGSTASISGTASVCIGSATTLSSTGVGTWSSSNTAVATVGSGSGIVTGVTAGTSIITYALADGCRATQIVTVNALPTALTGTASVCVGSNTTLSSTTTGGTWSSSTPAVGTVTATVGAVTGISAGTTTIIYTLSTGCSRSSVVTVNAAPSISGAAAICAGSTLSLLATPSGGTWASGATTVATVGTSGVVTGVAAGTAAITYTATGGCKSNVVVTVYALPATITGTASVCAGVNTTLASTTTGGSWFSGNDSIATVGMSTGIVTGVSSGTVSISYILVTGCMRTMVVTVNAAPASIGGSLAICVGTSTSLTNAVSGGTWTSGTVSVASIGSTTGVLNGLVAGTSIISYTMPGSCRTTAIATVMALPANITGTASVCEGSVTTLTNTTTGGIWVSSMPSVATVGTSSGIVSGSIAGTTTISYILSTGCYKSIVVTVNATPAPVEGLASVCAGSTTSLSSSTSGGTWFSNNTARATVSTAGVVTGVAAGTATISYTIAGGCRSTVIVTVNALPVAIAGTLSACEGSNSTLTNTTTGGAWSVSDTSKATVNASTGVVTGVLAGTTVVTYTLPTGCYKTAIFTVNAVPAAITGTAALCVGTTASLTSATTPAVSWGTSTPAVATVTSAGVVTGVAAGTATITYTIGNGCKTTKVVTVNGLPGAIAGTLKACPGTTTTLSDTTAGGVWNSGNTSVATIDSFTGEVTGIIPGTTIITYTVATGCKKTAIVTINPLPSAISGTGLVCVGSTTAFTNTGGGTWSSWVTTVATVSGTGVVTGVSEGISVITYTLSTGCSVWKEVTVNALPAPITGTTTLCAGNTTTLFSGGGGEISTPSPTGTWSSSNVAIATVGSSTGIVTGVAAGTAVITFTNINGCRATTVVTVSAFAAITGTTSACVGLTTTLSNTTTGGTWSSNDTTIATIGATSGVVTGVASGTVSITYTLPSGCIRTTTVTINVLPSTISGASTVCAGSTTTLTTSPTGGTWTSSAPAVASIGSASGVVTGVAAGAANITYTAGFGCRVTTTITVNAIPAAIGGTVTACIGTTTTLTDATTGGIWSSSNPAAATIGSTGIVTGISAGTSLISYTIATGCVRTTTVTINAIPAPISGTLSVCVGSTTSLTDSVTGGTWSSSNTLIASVGVSSGVVTGAAAGVVNITYSIGTCRTISSFTVNALPAAITGPSTACVGTPITFSSTTTGGTWAADEAGFVEVGETSGLAIGYAAGTETISYILPTGCMRTKVVTFNPTPSITSELSTICEGGTTLLTATIEGGTWSSSNTSVANVGSSSGLFTAVGGGSVTITYTLSTGCKATMEVSVTALPVITGTASVYAGSTTTLTGTPSGGMWFTGASTIATIDSFGVVTGISAGTALIYYVGPFGCAATVEVTVNPLGTDITGTLSVCAGSTTSLGNAVSGGTWTSANDTIATVDMTTGVVTGNIAGTVTISYTLPSSEVVTAIVTVNPIPSITGVATMCEGSTTTLSGSPSGGVWTSSNLSVYTVGSSSGIVTAVNNGEATILYTLPTGCIGFHALEVKSLPEITGTLTVYVGLTTTLEGSISGTWSSSNDSIATVDEGGVVTGVATGTVTIVYTSTAGCMTTAVVTVSAAPTSITGTMVVCAGSTTTLSHSTFGGTWSSESTAIATVSPSGVVTGVSAGTVTISYTLPSSAVVTAVVTVNALPASISGTAVVCSGASTTLSDSTSGGVWSSSNSTIASVDSMGIVTGGTSGAAIITYTLPTGCYKTVVATVNALPTTITGTTGICVGATSVLTSSTGGVWSSSDTTVATVSTYTSLSGLVTGIATGSATISYTLSTGCARSVVVNINSAPSAITGSTGVCIGGSASLSSATTGGTWSSSNTVIATVGSTTGVYTGAAAGTATITYTLGGSCRTTATVTVYALPPANTGTAVVCEGANTTLSNTTTGGAWSTTDTAHATVNASTGVVTGVLAGTATITYTVGTGCQRTTVVTINAAPTTITGSLGVCIGSSSSLSSTPTGGTWSSSNTAVANVITLTGVVTGGSAGTATITYTAPGGCKTTTVVNVSSAPAAITGASSVCAGATITLADVTSGGVWSSSSDSIATVGATGIVTGVAGGTVTISYATGAGCVSTKLVTVNPAPAAITGTTGICVGSTTTLNSATGTPVSWTSSNTAVATVNSSTAVVTGVSTGTTTITYTIGSGCYTTRVVTVNSTPATIGGASGVCNGATITLTNSVSGGIWSSPSANVSVVDSTGAVTGVTNGTAIITYTTGASCFKTKTITINAAPAAITGYKTACIGLTTLLSNTTSGAWASSDTTVAKVTTGGSNTTVTGMSAGIATITYTLASTGCSSATVVTVVAVPSAITGNGNICVSTSTTLANSTPGGTWSSSNTAYANVGSTTGIVTANALAGNATISYSFGTNCRVTTMVTVRAIPNVISGPTTLCIGSVTNFSSTTTGGTWSSSTSAATVVAGSAANIGSVTAVSGGVTTLSYTTAPLCSRTLNVTIAACRGVGSSTTTGVEEVQAGDVVSVYPNPTNGTFTLTTQGNGMFYIYSLEGRELVRQEIKAGSTVMNMPQGIAQGVYMSRFVGDDGKETAVRLIFQQ